MKAKILFFTIVLMTVQIASADPNVTITSPAVRPFETSITVTGNSLPVSVYTNDSNVSSMTAYLLYQPSAALSRVDANDWQGNLNITGLANGDYKLVAYGMMNGVSYYVSSPTVITISNPIPTPSPTPTPTPAPTLKLNVTGCPENITAGYGFYILVTNESGAKVDGASVSILYQNIVKSMPGQTVNGRLFVSTSQEWSAGQYLILVTKPNYPDFQDSFTVDSAPQTTPTSTTYGSLTITVYDVNNKPLQSVQVQPSGNTTDSNGTVFIGGQPLNTPLNFSFTLNGFNTTYLPITLSGTQNTASVTMHSINGDLKNFSVTGYNDLAEAGSMFLVKVSDSATGIGVQDAQVIILDPLGRVKSMPGNTSSNGKIYVNMPQDNDTYNLEVQKDGYADWISEDIKMLIPKVTFTPAPTPTPTPTAQPTPDKKYWSDSMMTMTDAEHSQWLQDKADKEKSDSNLKNLSANPIAAPTYQQPPQQDSFPWIYLIFGLVAVGGIWKYSSDKKHPPSGNFREPNAASTEEMLTAMDTPEKDSAGDTVEVSCSLCNMWRVKLPIDTPLEIRKAYLADHVKKVHDDEDADSIWRGKDGEKKIKELTQADIVPPPKPKPNIEIPEETEAPEREGKELDIQSMVEEIRTKGDFKSPNNIPPITKKPVNGNKGKVRTEM